MGCAQSKTEDVVPTNPPAADVTAETEPVVATEEPKVEEPATVEETAAEPEVEEPKTVEPAAEPSKGFFKVTGHEIDESGVVFYIVETVEGEVAFKKRFSEFKALIVALGNPKSLPALPAGGLGSKLRGKHNPALIKERETQLNVVVNAIGNNAELSGTDAFKKFAQ